MGVGRGESWWGSVWESWWGSASASWWVSACGGGRCGSRGGRRRRRRHRCRGDSRGVVLVDRRRGDRARVHRHVVELPGEGGVAVRGGAEAQRRLCVGQSARRALGGLEPAVHVQAHGRAVERHRHVVPRIGLQRRSADHRVDAATRPALEHDALATVRRGAVRRDYQRVSVVGRVGLLADHAAPAGGGVGARGPDPSLEREGRGAGVIVGVTETDGRRVTEAGRGIRRVPRRRREAEPDAARIAAAARAPGIERGRPGRLAQAPVRAEPAGRGDRRGVVGGGRRGERQCSARCHERQ